MSLNSSARQSRSSAPEQLTTYIKHTHTYTHYTEEYTQGVKSILLSDFMKLQSLIKYSYAHNESSRGQTTVWAQGVIA